MFRHLITFLAAALLAFAAHAAQAAVDVNKANQAELESIKGIGPGLSTRILQARASGGFKDWNDMIERVSGVGQGNAARYSQAGLTVSGRGFDGGAATSQKAKKSTPATQSEAGMEQRTGKRAKTTANG